MFASTIRYLPSVLAPILTQLGTLVILARALDGGEFGLVALGQAGANVLTLLTASWAGTAGIRYLSADAGTHRRLAFYKHLSFLVWLQVIFVGAVSVSFALVVPEGVARILLMSAVAGLPAALLVLPLHSLRAINAAGHFNTFAVLRHLAPTTAGLLYVWKVTPSAAGYQVVYGVALLLLLPLFDLRARARLGPGPSSRGPLLSPALLRRLIRFGSPLIPSYLLSQSLAVSDRFVIAAALGERQAGVYSAGYSMASFPMQFIVGALAIACGPDIVRAWDAEGVRAAGRVLRRWMYFDLLISGAVALVILIGAGHISLLILGPSFPNVSSVIRVVVLGEVVLGAQWFLQRPLVLLEQTRPILVAMAAAATMNLIVNIMLIPSFGIIAAAWTTLAANTMLTLLIGYLSRRAIALHKEAAATRVVDSSP